MTDKEKFKKTFDKLHASPDVLTEVLNMTANEKVVPIRKKHNLSRVAVAAAALILTLGSGATAYAMDLGGIQRIVQIWIHGDQTSATFTIDNGTYSLDYTDENGKEVHQGGGGVAFNEDGTERPVTDEEIMEHVINTPTVSWEDDGRIWVYYMNQKIDITDKFEDGYCYVKLEAGGETKYMTVKYSDPSCGGLGYGLSTHAFLQPNEFSVGSEDD